MIKIAIVEDDIACSGQVSGFIKTYGQENNINFEVKVFDNGLSFISDYKPYFDLVFMDINMPKLNGMETAKILYGLDKNICIIFMTTIIKYAVKGYEVDAVDFIVKPFNYYNFIKKLERAITKINNRSDKEFIVNTDDGVIRLLLSDIEYISIEKHYLSIHTANEAYTERGTMKEMEEKLRPYGFSRSSNGCLVNLKHVKKIGKTAVELLSSEQQISRQKRNSFIEDFMNYMRETK